MMADRTYNQVDARLYREWRFTKPARAILAHIIAICPNQYGIYDPSPYGEVVDWWDGLLDRSCIIAAWDELVAKGVMRLFRNNECLWLLKKFKRELKYIRTEKNRAGVVNFLENYAEIRDEFCSLYGIQVTDSGIQIANSAIQVVSRCRKTEPSESDTDTESDINNLSSATPPAGKQLDDLVVGLPAIVRNAWEDFAAMVADNRVNKRVRPSVLLKIIKPVVASNFPPDALAYGLEQATKAGAESHVYILKAAASYGQRRVQADPVAVKDGYLQSQEQREFRQDRSGMWIDDDGQVWQGDTPVKHSADDIKRLGDAIRDGNLLGGLKNGS